MTVFKFDLEAVNALHGIELNGLLVPEVIVHVLEHLQNVYQNNNQNVIDLYRNPLNPRRIKEIVEEYNSGNNPDWSKLSAAEAVGVTKEFLASLPSPVLPAFLDPVIISLVQSHLESGNHHKNAFPEIYSAMRLCLGMLPVAEAELFQYLAVAWSKVMKNVKSVGKERRVERNWMAAVMTPYLTQVGLTSPQPSGDRNLQVLVIFVELILENVDVVFCSEEEFILQRKNPRISASFLRLLGENRGSSYLAPLPRRSNSEDELSNMQLSRSMNSVSTYSSVDDDELEGFDRMALHFAEVDFPVIRLVPMNNQFPKVDIQLSSVLKFCRVLKKGNLKKGLENCQTFAFDSKCVSREHAEISWIPESRQIILKDLKSTCGTRVNDKTIPPEVPFRIGHGDTIILGENIPEAENENDPRMFDDHEVPPENRCVRMVIEFLRMPQAKSIASMASSAKQASTMKKLRRKTTLDIMNAALHLASGQVQTSAANKRGTLSFALHRSNTKRTIEKIDVFDENSQTHSVELSRWKTKRTISVIKLPSLTLSFTVTEPEVTTATMLKEERFYQIFRNGEISGLFNRVKEDNCRSLELASGKELAVKGDLKAHHFQISFVDSPMKSVAEVFGWEVETSKTEGFYLEYSLEHQGLLGTFIAISVLSTLDINL